MKADFDYIAHYWDKQATIWSEEKQDAWLLPETRQWAKYFKELKPLLQGNKALDVGTASGYFANIMALEDYSVTAIDLSQEMINEAKKTSLKLNIDVDYKVMNAEQLLFPDNSFDFIFTRLMTWILPDVEQFYASCFRVLKKGGMLINFDGDFGTITFSQEGHERYPEDVMEEANRIKQDLEISKYQRPQKDIELLHKVGFSFVEANTKTQNRILEISDEASSLFEIKAIKPNI